MEDFKKFFSHLKYLTGQLFLITVVREWRWLDGTQGVDLPKQTISQLCLYCKWCM